jgi:hypothetical protein
VLHTHGDPEIGDLGNCCVAPEPLCDVHGLPAFNLHNNVAETSRLHEHNRNAFEKLYAWEAETHVP